MEGPVDEDIDGDEGAPGNPSKQLTYRQKLRIIQEKLLEDHTVILVVNMAGVIPQSCECVACSRRRNRWIGRKALEGSEKRRLERIAP